MCVCCVCACMHACTHVSVCVCVCVCVCVFCACCVHIIHCYLCRPLPPGQTVDITSDETSIHVVGALLKDLLRSVPGGILSSSRYTEFVATNDIKDVDTRVHHIQK